MRCTVTGCRRLWSVHPSRVGEDTCPCGGELEMFDLEAHKATLPYAPMDPTKT